MAVQGAMDILAPAQESISFPSCGRQPEGMKRSQPIWTMPKASREQDQKLFISKKHGQDVLGRDSPGFPYEPKRIKEDPKWGFPKAIARPPPAAAQYPETSNNLMSKHPEKDALKYKYPTKNPVISTCPRTAERNAPDFHGYKTGTISPGPQRYEQKCSLGTCVRLAHAPSCDQLQPKWTMRPFTKVREWQSQTGEKVGPGCYPTPGACEEQASSVKPSKPRWKMSAHDRFAPQKHHDTYKLWDGHGEKRIQFNRTYNSTPSFSFGTSTRMHAKKIAPALTDLDKGPVAKMGHARHEHPSMPPRREVVKCSDVLSGS